jgi:uncharacterized protein
VGTAIIDNTRSPHAVGRAVALEAVSLAPGFWQTRYERTRDVTLPYIWDLMKDPARGHVFANFRVYAGVEKGEVVGSFWYEELLYKWIEAASYVYATEPGRREHLEALMDEAIELIARAQEPDGYLCVASHNFEGRFVIPRRHELYDMGHLITAACVHHRATGKTTLLDVARRVGDLLYATFVPDPARWANFSNTKSYIMAVVDLYRATGDRRYLELANVFVDLHGYDARRKAGRAGRAADDNTDMIATADGPAAAEAGARAGLAPDAARKLSRFEREGLEELEGSDIRQSRVPLRDEQFVVGHAVNFTYLYASAADLYMEEGDRSLMQALERLWADLVGRKMYVNGGVCPLQFGLSIRRDRVGEAAGDAYELPNDTAYNETCAQIGNLMWNWRMLLATGEPRYADIVELNLYNSTISSVGMDGTSWFYMNPLKWYGEHHDLKTRKHQSERYEPALPPHYDHTCCPSNLTRMELSVHGLLYTQGSGFVSVDHYAASRVRLETPAGPFVLVQETRYPWDGTVDLRIETAPAGDYALRFRIPEWAAGARWSLNGAPQGGDLRRGAYHAVSRRWTGGDVVRLELPMPVRLLAAHPRVDACENHVAVKRGPVLYCLESPDLPRGVSVFELALPGNAAALPVWRPDLFGGVMTLECELAADAPPDWDGPLYREIGESRRRMVHARLIPYFCWANRGPAEMTVWLPLLR